ncbi:MAG: hypothetical protein J0I80_03815 [Sphingomonas sp.]|nr:hypothetical protein [Sphingomonas sp.]
MTLPGSRAAALAGFVLLAGCQAVPPPKVAPPPPAPIAPPPVAVARPALPWDVAPVEPGDWSYRKDGANSTASFARPGDAVLATVNCRAATRQVAFSLAIPASSPTIRTSYGALSWPLVADPANRAMQVAVRPASDNGFDWIAYSRGRIGIESGGQLTLVLPVEAEIARVVEDCRN